MRALGRALGTSAMALYFHYASKDALLVAVGRALVASAPALVPFPGREGRGLAQSILAELRAIYDAHPNAYVLVRAELSRETARVGSAAPWPRLSPARADLLRVMLVTTAAESPALDAELLALFFG